MLLAPAVAVGLAGCGARDGVKLSDSAMTVSDDTAFALPPPGGPAVVNVVQREFSNSTQQDVYLFTSASTPGQNVLRVQMFGPVGIQMDGQKALGYSSIRASQISAEMRREFPGIAMAKSPLFLQNNYGPFGYAFGRGHGNDGCLYGWQQVRASQADRSAFRNRGTIQVRLRLCEDGASEQKLLSTMYNYTVRAAFNARGWNPYGEPSPVDPAIGQTGNPIYPSFKPAGDEMPLGEEVKPSPAYRPRPAPRVAEKAETLPQPVFEETVPLPSGVDKGTVVVPSPDCMMQSAGATQCK